MPDVEPVHIVLYRGPRCFVPAGAYGIGPAGFRGIIITPEFELWIADTFRKSRGGIWIGATFVLLRSAGGYIFHEFTN